jgi:hypothetical protein
MSKPQEPVETQFGSKQWLEAFQNEEETKALAEFAQPEQAMQAVPYPVDIFAGTLAGEFAYRNTQGNCIPSELFIEAFLTVLGAVVGSRAFGSLHRDGRRLGHRRKGSSFQIVAWRNQRGIDEVFLQEHFVRAELYVQFYTYT